MKTFCPNHEFTQRDVRTTVEFLGFQWLFNSSHFLYGLRINEYNAYNQMNNDSNVRKTKNAPTDLVVLTEASCVARTLISNILTLKLWCKRVE